MDKRDILRKKIDEKRRGEIRAFFDERGAFRSVLGRTVLGREIDMYRIGTGERAVVYVGVHHALEALCENILLALIYDMCVNPENKSVGGINRDFLLQKFTFFVIPALNLDGIAIATGEGRENILYERQRRICSGNFDLWQANARGVDLNHNYDAGFFEYKAIEAKEGLYSAPSRYSGEYPESEPESRAVANLVRTVAPSLVLSLHTQGVEIYFSPKTSRVQRLCASLASEVGYRVAYPSGSAKYGGLSDYTGAIGIPSLTLELGLGKNPLPISHAEPIYSRVGNALITLPTIL